LKTNNTPADEMIPAMSEWKVNKEINIGEILTVLTMLAVMVGFIVVQDRRIERNTIINEQQTEQIQDVTRGIDQLRLENKSDMNRMDSKLDDIKNLIIKQDR
jgi:cytochrome c biogenesis factor